MQNILKNTYKIIAVFVFLFIISFGVKAQASQGNSLIFFWAEGCPHCEEEAIFLDKLQKELPDLKIERYEVSKNYQGQKKLSDLSKKLNFNPNGVPITIYGDDYVIGFTAGLTDQKIREMVENTGANIQDQGQVCTLTEPCLDDKVIKIPVLGEIRVKDFSLPALAVILGALDGFNPCAMWVLIFLISLLLNLNDRRKMWILGFAFIIASATVYFVFMVAWLNLLLFIGFIALVRIIIGLVALGGGLYSLRDYWKNPNATCEVTDAGQKQKTIDKLKAVVNQKNFILALIGIVVLAFAVNLVELICSAGLPAVFTQVLTLSNLPTWEYYLYILVYIFFFMLDDIIIFSLAMLTMRITGFSGKYSRASRLIGGLIMVAVGLILIFKPAWLMF